MKIRVSVSGCDGDDGVLFALLHTKGALKGLARTTEARKRVKKIIKGK